MKWIQFKIHTTTADEDLVGEVLCEMGIQGFEISDHIPPTPEEEKQMHTDIPADLGPDDGSSIITFYTEGENNESEREFFSTGSSLRDERLHEQTLPEDPQKIISLLMEKFEEYVSANLMQLPKIEYCIQDDSLWKDKWKDSFKAFRVSEHIIVKPVWEDTPDFATEKDIILQIDPGSAFGTGTHETTRLCMLALEKHITPTTRILDAGCGSGILAISALLSGASSAFCLDIDPSAVTGTMENAKLNHLNETQIQAITANILEDPDSLREKCPEPFDIAVANILADVIIPLSDFIGPFIKKEGLFISSGILAEKAEDVKKALLKNHFEILETNTLGDWVSFTARKK